MKKYCWSIGFILSLAAFCFGQASERTISFPEKQMPGNLAPGASGKFAPTDLKGLELIELSVEEKNVTVGKSFTAGDDWLKTLKVKLKNVSGKTISSVRMSFSLPEAVYKDGKLAFSLAFGSLSAFPKDRVDKAIKPDEEFEMAKTEEQYNADKNFWISRTGINNIHQVIIGMVMVKFEDGTTLLANMKPPTAEPSK